MSKKQQTKTVQLKKPKEEEVSGSEESEEQPTTKAPVAPKTVAKKKDVESSEEEESDEKPKAKTTTDKGKVVPAKNAPTKATPAKKKDESSEEEESSEEVVAPKTNGKGTTTKTPAKPATPVKTPAKKKDESSEEEESSEELKVPAKKGTTTTPKKTGKQDKMEESEESDSDELHIVKAGDKTATPAQKRKREPEKDTNSKKPKFGGSSGGSGGNTKVRLGNLSFELDGKEDEIRAMFEDCGTINNVELIKRQDQSFAGVAIIEFDSMDACNKALEKHDEEFYGRKMNLSMAKESGAKGGARGKGPSEKPEGCTTVFIGNLSYQVTEEEVREFFSPCGKIQDIRWPKGDFTGIGWVEFEDTSSVDEAVKLAGQNLAGRMIRVDYAAPRKTQNKW